MQVCNYPNKVVISHCISGLFVKQATLVAENFLNVQALHFLPKPIL